MVKLKEPESMEECTYFSRRVLNDGHKIVLWIFKNSPEVMNVNFQCVKCKHQDSLTAEYELPYTFNCPKCNEKIKITPLKGKKKGLKKKK